MARSAKPQSSRKEPGPLSGLTFAVYARKSTEDARHEDHRSTARQIAQATRYVEARGGRVLEGHLYTDENISGAEFRDRPGLARLMSAVENGRPFDAIVMSDGDRLGREQYQTGYLLKKITDSGCRLFFYLEDREAILDDATNKLLESIRNFGREFEREKARQRCRDKAEAQARSGQVAGGEPYGYRNVKMKGDHPAEPGEVHDYVRREVNEEEAPVVVGVYTMYAAGWGFLTICKTLNGDPRYADQLREFFGGQAPAPARQHTGSWSPPAIRNMLRRPLYAGRLVWGRTTKVDRGGRAGVQVRADRPLVTAPAPEVRIVPDPLWEAVQRRLQAARESFLFDTKGRLWGKPDRRREGRYLLSGLAQCGACGYNITVLGGSGCVYGCARNYRRGTCGNNLAQPVAVVDAAFLRCLEQETMTPQQFRYAIECALERAREQLARGPNRTAALEREQAALARKIARLVAAIGNGRGPAALVQEIKSAEAQVREIEAELARLAAAPALTTLDLQRIEREVEAQLSRFADLLRGNVPRARQALKHLLVDRVVFTPTALGKGRRAYAFAGEVSYGAVLREVALLRNFPEGM